MSTTERILLILGFGVFVISILVAYSNPATSYELSIYRGTPFIFWIGSINVLLVSITLAISSSSGLSRSIGVLLGSLTMTAIISLPIIRGFHYVGEGDSLSHLGTTQEISSGILPLLDLRYPAIHTHGAILGEIANISLTHSLLLYISIFLVSFFVFVPLAVRVITRDRWTTYIGIFSGFLILPINHVSGHMIIHPTSQAVVFAPALIYLFILFYRSRSGETFLLFMAMSVFYILLHPQQAANYILFFIGFGVAALFHFNLSENINVGKVNIQAPILAFILLFWLWASNLPLFEANLSSVLMSVFTLFAEDTAAESVSTRGASLAQLGGSVEELFFKLFLIPLTYSIFAGLLMFLSILAILNVPKIGRLQSINISQSNNQQRLYFYITVGFAGVFGIFVLYLLAGITDQYFRHYAFMMAIVTIIGSISLGRVLQLLEYKYSKRSIRLISILIIIAFLSISLPVVFSSPYDYQDSNHVTEAQMQGFESTFEYEGEDISYAYIRSATSRYGQAINGPSYQGRSEYYGRDGGTIPDSFNNQNIVEFYDEPTYLTITGADRVRDPVLYNGFRFNQQDFEYLDNSPGINKIHSSGEFDNYLVMPQT